MSSPFPGMNPFLEQDDVWQDFHQRFATFAAGSLAAQVGSEYIVKIDEHLYIHELSAEQRLFLGRADVSVSHAPGRGPTATIAPAALTAPIAVALPAVEVERDAFVEIRDRRNRQLITVVELLSRSNKFAGPDRDPYEHKRIELVASGVNLVEIDLLRGGPRLPVEGLPECDYYALICRPADRPRASLWPVRLHDPLPIIPIPLRSGVADIHLDLQQLLHRIYDDARYDTFIYDGSPQPALASVDAEWARSFLPS